MINLKDSIQKRISVRSYSKDLVSHSQKDVINAYVSDEKQMTGVFGNRTKILCRDYDKSDKTTKIGYYGVITNANTYLVCITENNKECMVDLGYSFEKLILFITSLDLATCWLGGTFDRQKLSLYTTLQDNEFIPIISPVGYPSKRKSLIDSAVRKLAKPRNRIEPEILFHNKDFGKPIEDTDLLEKLNYVRLAPSASNKQPWRIVIDGKTANFFIERNPKYLGNKLGYDIQMVDMGIALAHFEIAFGKCEFKQADHNIKIPNENTEYLISAKFD